MPDIYSKGIPLGDARCQTFTLHLSKLSHQIYILLCNFNVKTITILKR